MSLQSSGQISISDIISEFGGLSSYNTSSSGIALQNPQTTVHQNGSVDDGFVTISLGFNIIYDGNTYSTVYVGSNSYITFGAGSSIYAGVSASNTPALPTIKLSAADNSYQKVTSGSPLGAGTKTIRFEGTASTSGTVGAPNMVWEVTFYQNSSQINITWGTNSRGTGGTGGFTDGAIYLYQNNAVFCGANTSNYVNVGGVTNVTLNKLETSPEVYGVSINQGSTFKPNGLNPNSLSEWYSYNNSASSPPIPVYIYLSYSNGSGQGYENSNSFEIIDNTTSTIVYGKYNIMDQSFQSLEALVYFTPGHDYTLNGYADETFMNSTVEVSWRILDFDDSYTETYTDWYSTSGYGYEQQDIYIVNPTPGTSQGFLEVYGSLNFF